MELAVHSPVEEPETRCLIWRVIPICLIIPTVFVPFYPVRVTVGPPKVLETSRVIIANKIDCDDTSRRTELGEEFDDDSTTTVRAAF